MCFPKSSVATEMGSGKSQLSPSVRTNLIILLKNDTAAASCCRFEQCFSHDPVVCTVCKQWFCAQNKLFLRAEPCRRRLSSARLRNTVASWTPSSKRILMFWNRIFHAENVVDRANLVVREVILGVEVSDESTWSSWALLEKGWLESTSASCRREDLLLRNLSFQP